MSQTKITAGIWTCATLGCFLGGQNSAFAYCEVEEKSKESEAFCQVINSVERNVGCSSFSSEDLFLYDVCVSLNQLKNTGSCKEIKNKGTVDSFIICNEIFLGLDGENCDRKNTEGDLSSEESQGLNKIVSAEVRQSMCELGRYVKRNYPVIVDARDRAIMEHAVEIGLDSQIPLATQIRRLSIHLDSTGVPIEGLNQKKMRSQEVRLGTLILKLIKSNHTSVSTAELASYVRKMIEVVEKHRKIWVGQAEAKKSPVTIKMGKMVDGDIVPSKIQVFPTGKVVIYLDEIMIDEQKKIVLKKLGAGTFKEVSQSFDYDVGVSESGKKSGVEEAALASGIIRSPQKRGKRSSEELHSESLKDLNREFLIQSLFNGKTGVAVAGSVAQMEDEVQKKNIVTTQKFYPYDLLGFVRYLNADQIDSIEGVSKEQIKINLAIDLLEGLSAIHEEGILHRDIKPGNIFVGYDDEGLPHAYIADFGAAYDTRRRPEFAGSPVSAGTIHFLSPDGAGLFGKKEFNQNLKHDIWAMGLSLYHLYFGHGHVPGNLKEEFPYLFAIAGVKKDPSKLEKVGIVFTKNPPSQDSLEFVIFQMLQPDPDLRPTAKQALSLLKELKAKQQGHLRSPRFHLMVNTENFEATTWESLTPTKSPAAFRGIQKLESVVENRLKKVTDDYTHGVKKSVSLPLGEAFSPTSTETKDSQTSQGSSLEGGIKKR
jgi:serine/threonine protein kinase